MWFPGSIPDAVAKAKAESKLFVVFVEGPDDVSKTSCTTLESIGSKIQDKAVAIKIAAESEEAKHFNQMFPIMIVPSTFIIKNGKAQDIVPLNVNPDEFVAKLDHVWDLATDPSPQVEAVSGSEAAAATPVLSPEDKKLLAQQKLAEVKAKKAREEEELEKQREASRRETGKAVLQAKKTREEAEMAAILEERRRDKLLEKQARERALANIARDREDKKRRLEQEANKSTPVAPVVQVPPTQPMVIGDSARIQFRFPDGHTTIRQFKSSDTLFSARTFVVEHASLDNFTLSTTYPRRIFTDSESEKSLQDLGLVPSAVLMVIPKSERNRSLPSLPVATGTWYNIPWILLLPFISIWNFINSFFGEYRTQTRDPQTSSSTPGPTASGSRAGYPRDGNVIRFRDQDSDDENNTYNGNSTQQM